MKTITRYGFILGVICLLAGSLLAIVNSLTREKILEQARAQERRTLLEVLPGAARFEPVKSSKDDVLYYKAYSSADELTGVAFKASGRGYSSIIDVMVGMGLDGAISSIKVMNHNETPGVGTRILESSFTSRFARKDIAALSQVQAIAGATVSSKAVINAVKKKTEEIQTLMKDGK
jgi:electron transport complex protein RnfG